MTTQTNKPRVICNLKKKKIRALTGLFWRNSSTKMPPERKKKTLAIDERSGEKHAF